MTTEEPKTETPIISLVAVKSKKEKEQQIGPTTNELVMQILETLKEESEKNITGLFAIVFDTAGQPKILWGGDFSMLTAVGALEYAKLEFMSNLATTDADA